VSRTQRLLDLVQLLRTHRYAVTAETLARDLGVSVRTVYRDILTLQGQGAPIEGEAGLGYLLRPGFTLPPLMFTVEELEALVLGMAWVARRPDPSLGKAARNLRAKVQAVLPAALARELESTTLLVGGGRPSPAIDPGLTSELRRAVRDGWKMTVAYSDRDGKATERTIWPFGLGYFEEVLVVLAWCELRQDLRHFRCDRIAGWKVLTDPIPEPRHQLLARWRQQEGVPDRD
jgi:predicted DNA-binding transcriptional regulator YafY